MVFCRILRYFVSESVFVIYAVLSQNMYLAIHALLRGENFNKKLCLWRKNDKYEVCSYSYSCYLTLTNVMWVLPEQFCHWESCSLSCDFVVNMEWHLFNWISSAQNLLQRHFLFFNNFCSAVQYSVVCMIGLFSSAHDWTWVIVRTVQCSVHKLCSMNNDRPALPTMTIVSQYKSYSFSFVNNVRKAMYDPNPLMDQLLLQ